MASRVVALIDMDCFYCQVEVRQRPELIGTPVAVVQYKTWKGGGIIAVNYEARAQGVTRFMRGDEAKAQCPSITLCSVPEVRGKADLTRYRDAGREVIQVFSEFSQCVERASVDEAFIDLTEVVEKRMDKPVSPDQLPNTFVVGFSPADSNEYEDGRKGVKEWLFSLYDSELDDVNAKKLAVGAAVVEEIRAAVYAKTGFRCSAGIAHNKIIAKLAAGLHKPNRQTVLAQSGVPILFGNLPVKKVRNLGGKLGDAVMEQLGCKVMADLLPFPLKDLQNRFEEKTGTWLYNIARGIDHEQVAARLNPKSIGCSKRFPGNAALATVDDVTHWLSELSSEASERLKDDLILNNRIGKVLVVMGAYRIEEKYNSFSRSGPLHSYEEDKIAETAMNLIKKSNTAPAISGACTPQSLCIYCGVSSAKEASRTELRIEPSVFSNVTRRLPHEGATPPLINLGLSVGKFMDSSSDGNNIKQFFSASTSGSKSLPEQKYDTKINEAKDLRSASSEKSAIRSGKNVSNTKQFFSAASSSSIFFSKNKKDEKNVEVCNEESSNDFETVSKKEDSNASVSIILQSNSDKTQPKSFMEKYFKRNRKKMAINQTGNEISINNEGSDTSNDHLQNCDSNETKSVLISGSDIAQESDVNKIRNISRIPKIGNEDEPSTSFFQPDCNSTALELCATKLDIGVKNVSDCSNGPLNESDESSDCWKTIHEIFPDLDNIDLDVVQLLPKKLQDVLYSSDHLKKSARNAGKSQEEDRNLNVSKVNFKNKIGRGRPSKKESGCKNPSDKTLSQYFHKTDDLSKDSTRGAEQSSSSNRTLSQYFSRLDEESKEYKDVNLSSKEPKNIEDIGFELEKDLRKVKQSTKDYEKIDCDEDDENADKLSSCDIFEDDKEETEVNNIVIEDVDLEEIPSTSCNRFSPPPVNKSNRICKTIKSSAVNESCVDMFLEDQEDLEPVAGKSDDDHRWGSNCENDPDIVNKLTPVILSDQTVDLSTIKCSLCDESIIAATMPEHMDYHAALSLHKELNSASAVIHIPRSSKSSLTSSSGSSKISESTSTKSIVSGSASSLKRKKNQSEKGVKKSMNIASFFSTR